MSSDTDKRALEYVENAVLTNDENILWKGRPNPARSASVGLTKSLFGIFFLGFAIFWIVGASAAGAFALFGLPFVGIGVWMVSTPLRTYWRAMHTYYAITNQRVLIIKVGRAMSLDVIFPVQITSYERTDKPDGSGSIALRTTVNNTRNGVTTSVEFSDGLWGIADVKGAAEAIADLQAAA